MSLRLTKETGFLNTAGQDNLEKQHQLATTGPEGIDSGLEPGRCKGCDQPWMEELKVSNYSYQCLDVWTGLDSNVFGSGRVKVTSMPHNSVEISHFFTAKLLWKRDC